MGEDRTRGREDGGRYRAGLPWTRVAGAASEPLAHQAGEAFAGGGLAVAEVPSDSLSVRSMGVLAVSTLRQRQGLV